MGEDSEMPTALELRTGTWRESVQKLFRSLVEDVVQYTRSPFEELGQLGTERGRTLNPLTVYHSVQTFYDQLTTTDIRTKRVVCITIQCGTWYLARFDTCPATRNNGRPIITRISCRRQDPPELHVPVPRP